MKHEKSCGAVIYVNQGGERRFLVERMRKGHVSLCKGHVEAGETEHDTARREIMEETALTVRFVDGFRETTEYSPYPGCMKEVVFFLAEAESAEATPQPSEVSEIYWLPLEDAIQSMTHEDDRRILSAAGEFLSR